MKKDNWEDYFIEGTNVLKNKFNIIDEGELEKKEKEITLKKLSYLNLFPIKGNFDEEHLRQIHKFYLMKFILLLVNIENVLWLKLLEIFMIQKL